MVCIIVVCNSSQRSSFVFLTLDNFDNYVIILSIPQLWSYYYYPQPLIFTHRYNFRQAGER